MEHYSKYFYGNKISDYGLEIGYVDYSTLAKAFDAVLNNEIMEKTMDIGCWEQESGFVDNSEEIEELQNKMEELKNILSEYEEIENPTSEQEERMEEIRDEISELEDQISELEAEQEEYPECYQFYIVSYRGAEILEEINEIVWYNEELDMYVWGVTHLGTSWDYVLTDIKLILDGRYGE